MAIRFTEVDNPRIGNDPTSAAATFGFHLQAPVTYAWSAVATEAVRRHAASSPIEIAGLLAGRVWSDSSHTFVIVEDAVPADEHVERSSVHVIFQAEAWDVLSEELNRLSKDTLVVGWYHSHPNLGAFFSGTDRETQRGAFRSDWQLGVVMDPQRGEIATFRGPQSLPFDPSEFVSFEKPSVTVSPSAVSGRGTIGARHGDWVLIASVAAALVGVAFAIAILARARICGWPTRPGRGLG